MQDSILVHMPAQIHERKVHNRNQTNGNPLSNNLLQREDHLHKPLQDLLLTELNPCTRCFLHHTPHVSHRTTKTRDLDLGVQITIFTVPHNNEQILVILHMLLVRHLQSRWSAVHVSGNRASYDVGMIESREHLNFSSDMCLVFGRHILKTNPLQHVLLLGLNRMNQVYGAVVASPDAFFNTVFGLHADQR